MSINVILETLRCFRLKRKGATPPSRVDLHSRMMPVHAHVAMHSSGTKHRRRRNSSHSSQEHIGHLMSSPNLHARFNKVSELCWIYFFINHLFIYRLGPALIRHQTKKVSESPAAGFVFVMFCFVRLMKFLIGVIFPPFVEQWSIDDSVIEYSRSANVPFSGRLFGND